MPTSAAPEIVMPPSDTLPPRPDSFARLLLEAQAGQHRERMAESVLLRESISGRLDRLDNEVGAVRADLANKPGKAEVRWIIGLASAVFVLMLVSFLTSRGVDTAQAVKDTKTLLAPTASEPEAPAVPDPAPTAPTTPTP